jgi:hypothetical protein
MAQLGAQAGLQAGLPARRGQHLPRRAAEVRYAPQSPPVPALSVVAARLAGADTKSGETAVPIDFRGGARSYRTVSALDVLNGRTPRSALRSKVRVRRRDEPGCRRSCAAPRWAGCPAPRSTRTPTPRSCAVRHPARDILIIALLALIPAAVAAGAAVDRGGRDRRDRPSRTSSWRSCCSDSGWIVPILLPLAALALSSVGLVVIRLVLAAARRCRRPAPGAPREPELRAACRTLPSLSFLSPFHPNLIPFILS